MIQNSERKYRYLGDTSDTNKYPLLTITNPEMQDISTDYKYVVAVPMADYKAITKHMGGIDKKLLELEKRVGIETQEDYMNGLCGSRRSYYLGIDKPIKFKWADELQPSVLSDNELDIEIAYDNYIQAADKVRNR